MRRVAVALLVLACTPASAAGQAADESQSGDRVVITGPVSIERGESADDVVVIDGPVSVAGRVRGDLVVVSGTLRLSGTVDGDVVTAADRAILGPRARVGGDLIYGDEKPRVPSGATIGGEVDRVNFDEITDPAGFVGAAALWIAMSVSALVLGLVLLWLAPRALDAAFAAASTSIGPTIGWGLLLFFGLPLLAVIALVTLVGIPLSESLCCSPCCRCMPSDTPQAPGSSAAVSSARRGDGCSRFSAGSAVLGVSAIIPILGGLVWFAATVVGLGAPLIAVWRARRDDTERASLSPA